MNTLEKRPFRTTNSFPRFFDSIISEAGNYANNSSKEFPAVNIMDNEDDIKILLAAPGLKKEDFQINLNNLVLSISVKLEEKDKTYSRKEYSYFSFSRSFKLPKHIELDKIEAHYEAGILTLSLPKKEEAKPKEPRQISVA